MKKRKKIEENKKEEQKYGQWEKWEGSDSTFRQNQSFWLVVLMQFVFLLVEVVAVAFFVVQFGLNKRFRFKLILYLLN